MSDARDTATGLSSAADDAAAGSNDAGAARADAGGARRRVIPPLPRGETNQNPPDIGLWALLREDLRTNGGKILQQGFIVLALHRLGNWRMGIRPKVLRLPFSIVYRFLYPFTEWLCGIKLSYTVKVGRRVKIEHFGGMILGARSIGDDCTLRQNTTLGIARKEQDQGKPIIEERVDIGAGACLLGHIIIGHDSIIGANAVVVRDVPPYSVVVGVPGRVIKTLNGPPCPAAPQPSREVKP
jgi:serine O-acetyltransferase